MPPDGPDSVTVPGCVAGWRDLHARFGSLPFADLFEPAIRHARDGYPASPITAEAWGRSEARFGKFDEFPPRLPAGPQARRALAERGPRGDPRTNRPRRRRELLPRRTRVEDRRRRRGDDDGRSGESRERLGTPPDKARPRRRLRRAAARGSAGGAGHRRRAGVADRRRRRGATRRRRLVLRRRPARPDRGDEARFRRPARPRPPTPRTCGTRPPTCCRATTPPSGPC